MEELSAIVKQLLEQRDRLNTAIAALEGVSNGASRKGSQGRTLSAAARARIAAAQRKRWAKFRAKAKKSA